MDKNEKNNLIDVDTPRNNSDSEDVHNNNDDNNVVLLTPEQQKTLEKHLTPPSIPISDDYNNNNNNKFDLNSDIHHEGGGKGGNKKDKNNKNNNSSEDNEDNSGGDEEKKKKKKKKDKKKNKKNKDQDENVDSEDIDRVVIQSPMLLKSKKGRENYQDNQYSTEMSPMDSNGNVKVLNSATPQIEIDPEMYFDGEKKEKKKKKKNGGGGGNKDKFLTPEERRIKENSKDAKSFFSNERTFLSWIGLTFSLGAIGTAILTWFGSEGVSLATGVFLWAIAMIFMIYSTMQFRRRGHAIRTKTQGPFDDQKGPLSLVAMVVIGVSIYLIFFVVIRPTVNIGTDIGNNSTKSL
ncbi:hypothetical protein RB653_008241 [Dictyostelium firmibasis]|uniref:DUF202 domain-containing protein n=1 Tax=Dictyostelium firmibasis TaxID=79012 RepID=A0AAN7YP64_9MYCE